MTIDREMKGESRRCLNLGQKVVCCLAKERGQTAPFEFLLQKARFIFLKEGFEALGLMTCVFENGF